MTTSDPGRYYSLGDAGCDRAFDDGCDRVHGAYDFGLELWGHVQLDLLEKVFRGAKATDNKNVLERLAVAV